MATFTKFLKSIYRDGNAGLVSGRFFSYSASSLILKASADGFIPLRRAAAARDSQGICCPLRNAMNLDRVQRLLSVFV